MSNPSINAAELSTRLNKKEKLNILDVREPMEYHTFNIGGQNIALGKLPAALPLLAYALQHEIIIVCKVGKRSKTAQSILAQNGYQHTRNLEGGLLALQKLNIIK